MLDLIADTTAPDFFLSDADSYPRFSSLERLEAEFAPRGLGNHRLGEVVDGELDLVGLPGRVASHLSGLHRRIAAAVVEDLPRPIECAGLSEADELIHQIEMDWRECGRGFPTDPDVPGWIDVLVDRTRCRFVEWCFRLLRTIGRGTVERIEPVDPGCGGIEQIWSTAEPDFLADDLVAALDGRMQVAMHDPLLSARRIPA
ncbi:MAG: hypothetical protein GY895_19740 [Phycisphaera sp.]|nr:hypothetical protein [Phycisphaera sp.]